MNETIVAFSQTKKRTDIGIVGVEIDDEKRIVYVRLAKTWKRADMEHIASDVEILSKKIQWDSTYADQLVGQHLLKDIEYQSGLNIFAINTQKNIKEPEEEEGMKRMDQTEMVQFFLSLKLTHKIQFPKKLSKYMSNLITQTEMFKENTTEQGTVSYYAPGDELDCLIKALMICCFAGRTLLEKAQMPFMIVVGEPKKSQYLNAQDTINRMLGKKTINTLSNSTSGILNP